MLFLVQNPLIPSATATAKIYSGRTFVIGGDYETTGPLFHYNKLLPTTISLYIYEAFHQKKNGEKAVCRKLAGKNVHDSVEWNVVRVVVLEPTHVCVCLICM